MSEERRSHRTQDCNNNDSHKFRTLNFVLSFFSPYHFLIIPIFPSNAYLYYSKSYTFSVISILLICIISLIYFSHDNGYCYFIIIYQIKKYRYVIVSSYIIKFYCNLYFLFVSFV